MPTDAFSEFELEAIHFLAERLANRSAQLDIVDFPKFNERGQDATMETIQKWQRLELVSRLDRAGIRLHSTLLQVDAENREQLHMVQYGGRSFDLEDLKFIKELLRIDEDDLLHVPSLSQVATALGTSNWKSFFQKFRDVDGFDDAPEFRNDQGDFDVLRWELNRPVAEEILTLARNPPTQEPPTPTIMNNYFNSGPNSRSNINANDFSTNTSSIDNSLFQRIYERIEEELEDNQERAEILQRLQALEQAEIGRDRLEKYSSFIALAANHMTLLAPLLPQLSAFAAQIIS